MAVKKHTVQVTVEVETPEGWEYTQEGITGMAAAQLEAALDAVPRDTIEETWENMGFIISRVVVN